MISEIRIKARAASMEEAEQEIEVVMGHASIAAYLEGLAPGPSSISANEFNRVYGVDKWNDLGLEYEGRVVLRCEPTPATTGGVRQYSFRVIHDESDPLEGDALPADNGKDVTREYMVLKRGRIATSDHPWPELSPLSPSVTTDSLIEAVQDLPRVKHVELTARQDGGWTVLVDYHDSEHSSGYVSPSSLREAVLDAYKGSIEERYIERSTLYQDRRGKTRVTFRLHELTEETLRRLMVEAEWKTLLVPDEAAGMIAARALSGDEALREKLAIWIDPGLGRNECAVTVVSAEDVDALAGRITG